MSDGITTEAGPAPVEPSTPPSGATTKVTSPLATTTLVLGIVTVVFAIIPGLSFIAGLPGFAAVALGALALIRKAGPPKRPIIGMALGGGGTLLAIIVSIGFIVSIGASSGSVETAPAPAQTQEAPTEEEIAAAEAEREAEAAEAAADAEAEAARAAEEEARAAEEAAAEAAARGTVAQQNALESAASYLSFTAFSYSGLIGQLEFEGYSTVDATWAVDRVGADWNEQAAASAANYLEFTSFSRAGLIDQLVFEGFTRAQAEYGATQVGL